jgi:hypothetical protein
MGVSAEPTVQARAEAKIKRRLPRRLISTKAQTADHFFLFPCQFTVPAPELLQDQRSPANDGIVVQQLLGLPMAGEKFGLQPDRAGGTPELPVSSTVGCLVSPHFSPGFVARRRRRAWIQGARREVSAGVLDSTSRKPTERNAVDIPGSAAAVETW